jgi:hypothetical protein
LDLLLLFSSPTTNNRLVWRSITVTLEKQRSHLPIFSTTWGVSFDSKTLSSYGSSEKITSFHYFIREFPRLETNPLAAH